MVFLGEWQCGALGTVHPVSCKAVWLQGTSPGRESLGLSNNAFSEFAREILPMGVQ